MQWCRHAAADRQTHRQTDTHTDIDDHNTFCVVCLLWPNGWMDEGAAWYRSRPRPRPHSSRWGPSSRESGTAAPPLFGPCLLWPRSPISDTAELLLYVIRDMHNKPAMPTSHIRRTIFRTPPPVTRQSAASSALRPGPAGCSHYVIISRDGRKLVTRVHVTLP